MKVTLLTTAALVGLAGVASAECSWGKYEATTAAVEEAPIPTADASSSVPETPVPLLPLEAETGEG